MIVKTKLTQAEYDEIETLVDQALSAPNKASAQKYIDRLSFLARDFEDPAHELIRTLVEKYLVCLFSSASSF